MSINSFAVSTDFVISLSGKGNGSKCIIGRATGSMGLCTEAWIWRLEPCVRRLTNAFDWRLWVDGVNGGWS